jgi:hypothetical protein
MSDLARRIVPSPLSVSATITGGITLAAGSQKDAFGRLRVSNTVELFAKALEYGEQPLFYENVTGGGGTATYLAAVSGVSLAVTTTGDSVIRQGRQYVRYRPGKSQQIFITGNFGGAEANVTKRIGYYDDDTQPQSTGDGALFQVDGSGVSVVLRSSTSGSSTDTVVAQANWNVDKLDGTGASGVTLDLTREQVMAVTFGWLGAAVVEWGFVIDGQIITVHTIYPANNLTAPFMGVPSLPVRWEIESTGGAGSMFATCASVQSEGGFNTLGVLRSCSRDGTARATSATTLVPLVSVRLLDAYRRAQLMPEGFSILGIGNSPADYEAVVLLNPTLGGAAFAPCSEITERDVTATTVTGGRVLATTYAAGGGGATKGGDAGGALAADVPITSSYDGTKDTLTLAVRPLGTSATNFFGSLSWREFY